MDYWSKGVKLGKAVAHSQVALYKGCKALGAGRGVVIESYFDPSLDLIADLDLEKDLSAGARLTSDCSGIPQELQ